MVACSTWVAEWLRAVAIRRDGVDAGLDGLALADLAGHDPGAVHGQALDRLAGVEHLEAPGRGLEQADVADLATALGIEGVRGRTISTSSPSPAVSIAAGGDDRADPPRPSATRSRGSRSGRAPPPRGRPRPVRPAALLGGRRAHVRAAPP